MGRRQGARPSITFGYQPKASGEDTGAWPAPGFTKLPPAAADPKGKCSNVAGGLGLGWSRAGPCQRTGYVFRWICRMSQVVAAFT